MAYETVARVEDLERRPTLCVQVRGIAIGLFRVGEEIHALENACPHAGDPLSEGRLEGHVIECASHGWRFDVRTGFRPEDADGFPIPRFAVRVADGAIQVDLDAPLNARGRRPRAV